jgi:hypothetical protein
VAGDSGCSMVLSKREGRWVFLEERRRGGTCEVSRGGGDSIESRTVIGSNSGL